MNGRIGSVPYRFHKASNLASRRLEKNDILIESSGGSLDQPVGRVMFVDENLLGAIDGAAMCASFCKRLTPDFNLISSSYLRWYLEWVYSSGQVERYQVQSTGIRNLQFEYMLDDLLVEALTRAEQETAASVLDGLTAIIRQNRRRIEILEEMARLLYREWFVHFRFPGHVDVDLVDSELGPIPAGWEVLPFTELAEFINGFAFKPSHLGDIGLPIVKIKELKAGVTNETPRYHGEDIKSKYFIDDGDILFSWSAHLDAYVWSNGRGLLNQHLFVVRPYELPALFVFHSLLGRMDQFRARSQGTTMKHIKRAALTEVSAVVPDAVTLQSFDSIVRPLSDLVNNLTQQNRVLREARDLLLPRLVSGELDVSSLDLDGLLA